MRRWYSVWARMQRENRDGKWTVFPILSLIHIPRLVLHGRQVPTLTPIPPSPQPARPIATPAPTLVPAAQREAKEVEEIEGQRTPHRPPLVAVMGGWARDDLL
jgi:hypothetical protein